MGFHSGWAEILHWIGRSEKIFIKKLSRNDSSWADDAGKHQSGFFIPAGIIQSGFFPELQNTNPAKPHIFDAHYITYWPASDEPRESTIKHYSNKGGEVHHTGIPKEQFRDLAPASLLISGKLTKSHRDASHWFMVVDSVSDEAEVIENAFSLEADFHFGLFDPATATRGLSNAEILFGEIAEAIRNGTLDAFVAAQALPSPRYLADEAQHQWLQQNGVAALNPFEIEAPGDAVMRISRDIEYAIYQGREIRLRAAEVARILSGGGRDPIRNMVLNFGGLDAVFLSSSQTRKSRAGLSFEHHVGRLLRDGGVRHQVQAVFGGRRPDFALPTADDLRTKPEALVVSLKTTLRERWKQLALERLGAPVFLATVDDRVSAEAIEDMDRHGIALVVPESLKGTDETEYKRYGNVITFRDFFRHEIRDKRPALVMPFA